MTCTHPDIADMDYWRGWTSDPEGRERWVNRCCRKCRAHWTGPEAGVVREFTSREWDAYLIEDFAEDARKCIEIVNLRNTSPECVQETLDF